MASWEISNAATVNLFSDLFICLWPSHLLPGQTCALEQCYLRGGTRPSRGT
jgi:hypothetical protein